MRNLLAFLIVSGMVSLSGCSTMQDVARAAYAASPATASSQPMFVCGSFVDPAVGKAVARPCARLGL